MATIDALVAYKFIKQLSTPWEKWEAYKLGLIDKNGERIKKAETAEEKKAYPTWKVLVRNLKRILDKLPGGASKVGSFAVALWMIKEEMQIQNQQVIEDVFLGYLDTQPILLENIKIKEKINTIDKGRYKHIPSKDIIFLKDNVKCSGSILNTEIFELVDYVTGNAYITTVNDIARF